MRQTALEAAAGNLFKGPQRVQGAEDVQRAAAVRTGDAKVELAATLPIHPAARLMPKMTRAEYEGIKESIARHGYDPTLPIVMHEGKILDGCHRASILAELGIDRTPFCRPFEEVRLKEETVKEFVWRMGLDRRQLNALQRAEINAQKAEYYAEQARQRRLDGAAKGRAQQALGDKLAPSAPRTSREKEAGKAAVRAAVEGGSPIGATKTMLRARNTAPEVTALVQEGLVTHGRHAAALVDAPPAARKKAVDAIVGGQDAATVVRTLLPRSVDVLALQKNLGKRIARQPDETQVVPWLEHHGVVYKSTLQRWALGDGGEIDVVGLLLLGETRAAPDLSELVADKLALPLAAAMELVAGLQGRPVSTPVGAVGEQIRLVLTTPQKDLAAEDQGKVTAVERPSGSVEAGAEEMARTLFELQEVLTPLKNESLADAARSLVRQRDHYEAGLESKEHSLAVAEREQAVAEKLAATLFKLAPRLTPHQVLKGRLQGIAAAYEKGGPLLSKSGGALTVQQALDQLLKETER